MKICKSIVGALATFLLLGVSSVNSTTAYVQMMDVGGFSFFVPGLCSVGVGDTVRWSNVGV